VYSTKKDFPVSLLTLSVQAALAAMAAAPLAALAQDDDVAALTNPTNTVELSVVHVNKSSDKFGEYSGLNKAGTDAVGNFNVRGGTAYGQNPGTLRWGVNGVDVGTTAQTLNANVANQGQWKLGLTYDELQHNITDSYQTPLLGGMGSNFFTLPANFGIINSTAVTNSPNPAVGTRNLSAAQLGDLQTRDVETNRKNTVFTVGYNFNSRLGLQFDYNHLEQSGAKLISSGSSSATTGAGAAGTWAGEAIMMLMNPTNYLTDNFNLALNYAGDKSYLSASYYNSQFRDGYNSVSWPNPIGKGSATTGATTTTLGGGYQSNALSTMPSNSLNQLNLNGGYNFRPATKLAGGMSYGRNVQNNAYINDPSMMQSPAPSASLNGLVETKNVNFKLTDQSIKNLSLSAGFKTNERDNNSPSNAYYMLDLGAGKRTEVDTPFSNRKTDFDLMGDYRLSKDQNLRAEYTHEDINRWCNGVTLASSYQTPAASSKGAGCVIVTGSKEDKFGLNYRFKSGDLNFSAGVSHAKRDSSVDHNALTALNDQSTVLPATVNASNYAGFLSYFDASRIENQLKASLNYQANDKLSFSLGGRYSSDNYFDSTLGVQNGHSASLNFETSYNYSQNGVASFYATQQVRYINSSSGASGNGATDNAATYSALVAPTNIFTTGLTDRDQTYGVNVRQKGLLKGKLDISADLSVSTGNTGYQNLVPYLSTCATPNTLSCGDTPGIYSRTISLKLRGEYKIDKKSTVMVGYMFQSLLSNDYYYNAYQTGYTPSTLLPTNQQSGTYKVNVITVSYIYTF